jgi:hypothetical protein
MSTAVGLAALAGGIVIVVWAAGMFVDGLLGVGRALRIAPFVLTIALSGFETENLAAGIAANAKGLPGAAARTFLGGVTFLALGVAWPRSRWHERDAACSVRRTASACGGRASGCSSGSAC